MQLSEKEIEDFIFEDLTHNVGMGLTHRGLTTLHTNLVVNQRYHKCKWLRQLDLGPYGRADIVGYFRADDTIYVELMELKSIPIEVADFEQILRYKKAIKEYVGKRFNLSFQMYLIGKGFNSGHYIHNCVPVSVVEYKYSLDGLEFEVHTGNWGRPDAKNFNFIKSLQNAEAVHGYR